MSPGGLGSTGSRLKPAAARIDRPTRAGAFSTLFAWAAIAHQQR